MNEPTRITLEKGLEWFKGDHAAAQMAVGINYLMHVWDDLVDRDKVVDPQDINNAFLVALVDLQLNPFYQRHLGVLHPLLFNAILTWELSTQLEREKTRLDIAHVLRYAGANLFVQMAVCAGGMAHARIVIRDIWLTVVEEPLNIYEFEISKKEV